MDKKVINEILKKYERNRDNAKYDQKKRIDEVYSKIPEIKDIDKKISKTGIILSKAILNNPDSYEEKLIEIQQEMEKLKREKAILLTENNIPLEYLDINYNCNTCKDTGFLENGSKCNCFKQALINKAYEMSNLNNILKNENFHTFDISVFNEEPFEDEDLTPRENMMDILNICEGFVIKRLLKCWK